MDPRGMMLDGEATLVVSGIPAAAGLVDLYYQMARTTWVTTPAQLEALLPPPSGWMRRIAKLIRASL
jgi:phosphatidylserine/phosphatidylglycerophosphate/cardiolipin synthase-like enzyme